VALVWFGFNKNAVSSTLILRGYLLLAEQNLLQAKNDLLNEKEAEISQLKEQVQYLLEQFRLSRHKLFESSPDQGKLFNEAEITLDEVTEPEKEIISYTRNKPKRTSLPKDLPREVVVHD